MRIENLVDENVSSVAGLHDYNLSRMKEERLMIEHRETEEGKRELRLIFFRVGKREEEKLNISKDQRKEDGTIVFELMTKEGFYESEV